MSDDTSTIEAIGNILLAITACYASLKAKKAFPYCLISFILILVCSLIQVATAFNDDVSGVRDEIHRLCYYFCIPLIATESCLTAGLQDLISLLNLLIPVSDYLLRFSSSDRMSIIDLAHFASLASIAYSAVLLERRMGFAVICSALMSNLTGTHRVVGSAIYPLFTMLLCFTTLSFLTNEPLKDIILNLEDVMTPST